MNRKNMYPGKCVLCGATVDAEAGVLTPEKKVMHNPGSCRPAAGAMVTPRVDDSTMEGAVDKVITLMGHKMAELVPELVEQNLDRLSRVAEIKVGKLPTIKVGVAHRSLPDILMAVVAGTHPFLVGPAGSGKTTLAEQIAETLKRKFYMEARVTSEFKLIGFTDAHGHVVRTQFREAYEHGGVFLFDEIDASDPDALTAFNAALANGRCAFPDALVKAHKDFVAIAAGNTFGRGADRQYVGRNQLDAATLDRFAVFEIDYDEQLERQLCTDADWVKRVQRVRRAMEEEKVRHIVSPRASIYGARLLAAGMGRDKVEEAVIWKGLDESNRTRVQARLGEAA
jgi:hypothetical protein